LERELAAVGIKTCGDIYPRREYLSRLFGEKVYEFLINVYLGVGRTSVQPAEEYERKSVGTESTFREMSGSALLREKLRWTAEELEKDMRRAECKGRTLVLKVKLHTFEVYTRQVVTPKAIYLADDLYNYSLPILAKLEQEMPGMKLRLMGLRCTHLVSTKKPDTLSFFGLKRKSIEPGAPADNDGGKSGRQKAGDHPNEDGEWEQWPEDGLDGYEVDADPEPEARAEGESPYRRHGKEILPNPTKRKEQIPEDEWWDCPICGRPQACHEKAFNDHIDLCLSRQTIRDTVQQEAAQTSGSRAATPEPKRARTGPEKKRGKGTNADDPRQKKLSFR
jgi:DNA polymerase kappa